MNPHMRPSIFSSVTGRYAFTVSVRGLRPQTVYGRHTVPCRTGRATRTQTVLDRVYADRTAALALEIDDPGAGWWEAPRRDLVDSATDFAWLVTKLVPTTISECAAPDTQGCDYWTSSPGGGVSALGSRARSRVRIVTITPPTSGSFHRPRSESSRSEHTEHHRAKCASNRAPTS
jgi:hypothetical protein